MRRSQILIATAAAMVGTSLLIPQASAEVITVSGATCMPIGQNAPWADIDYEADGRVRNEQVSISETFVCDVPRSNPVAGTGNGYVYVTVTDNNAASAVNVGCQTFSANDDYSGFKWSPMTYGLYPGSADDPSNFTGRKTMQFYGGHLQMWTTGPLIARCVVPGRQLPGSAGSTIDNIRAYYW